MNFERIWCITNPTPARRVNSTWNVYMAKFDPDWEGYPVWQTGLPAWAGHPTYHANVIQVKWEIIWTGGLPHLSGLPHLPGVPLLHVNWPLEIYLRLNVTKYNIVTALFIFFTWKEDTRGLYIRRYDIFLQKFCALISIFVVFVFESSRWSPLKGSHHAWYEPKIHSL